MLSFRFFSYVDENGYNLRANLSAHEYSRCLEIMFHDCSMPMDAIMLAITGWTGKNVVLNVQYSDTPIEATIDTNMDIDKLVSEFVDNVNRIKGN